MKCPRCGKTAVTLFDFFRGHLLDRLECGHCRAWLAPSRTLTAIYFVSMGFAFFSFFLSFPVMSEIAEAPSSGSRTAVLYHLIPYLVIPLQVVIIFIPALLYTVVFGRLKLKQK